MKINGPKAWFLAARPKTLTGAAAPVLAGGALAFHDQGGVDAVPFLLCLLFAFVMQIDSNLVNDYFDFLKGTDREDRLGPERACAQGWVTPKAMRLAIGVTTCIACVLGLPLIMWGGYELVFVGLLCVLFCFLYTTCLSYLGYGDLLVLVFFGIVPLGRLLRPVFFGFWEIIGRIFRFFTRPMEKMLKNFRKNAKKLLANGKKWFTMKKNIPVSKREPGGKPYGKAQKEKSPRRSAQKSPVHLGLHSGGSGAVGGGTDHAARRHRKQQRPV